MLHHTACTRHHASNHPPPTRPLANRPPRAQDDPPHTPPTPAVSAGVSRHLRSQTSPTSVLDAMRAAEARTLVGVWVACGWVEGALRMTPQVNSSLRLHANARPPARSPSQMPIAESPRCGTTPWDDGLASLGILSSVANSNAAAAAAQAPPAPPADAAGGSSSNSMDVLASAFNVNVCLHGDSSNGSMGGSPGARTPLERQLSADAAAGAATQNPFAAAAKLAADLRRGSGSCERGLVGGQWAAARGLRTVLTSLHHPPGPARRHLPIPRGPHVPARGRARAGASPACQQARGGVAGGSLPRHAARAHRLAQA